MTSSPTIHLHATNLLDPSVILSVNGVLRRYRFLTAAEVDTVGFLFRRVSALKALNYAKRHSEADEIVEA